MPRADLPAPLAAIAAGGYSGVSLFFVLSGFILAHVYGDAAASHRLSTRAFLIARFARIYPAYLAALIFALPDFVRSLHVDASAPAGAGLVGVCVAAVSMTQAWIPGWGCRWNCPGWSLSAEAFFYLAFPFIAPRLLALHTRTIGTVGLLAWAVAVAIAMFTTTEGPGEAPLHITRLVIPGLTAWTPLVRLPEFVLGICAARVLRTPSGLPRIGVAGAAAATLVLIAAAAQPPSLWRGLSLWPGLALVYAVLIAACSHPDHRSVLSTPALQRLGNASYSLYLVHAVGHGYFLAVVNRTWGREHAGGWIAFLMYVPLTIALSILMHDRVEVPWRRRLRTALAALPAATRNA